jgi:hypothetical protein
MLLVGESSPAGGTHFYRANSNLYRATRDALREAFALGDVPSGDEFLAWFRELGFWLVDLVDSPVDDLPTRERRSAVQNGRAALARTIRQVDPERIVAVMTGIGGDVRAAARLAAFDESRIDVLPFPLYRGRSQYVSHLAAIVHDLVGQPSASRRGSAGSRSVAEDPVAYGSRTLHEVIAAVLEGRHEWISAAAIARVIAADDLWRRPSDGAHPPPRQIGARVRQYPELFQVSERGIRLRDRTGASSRRNA